MFLVGATRGFFPLAHGATGMPPLPGPEFARVWLGWDSGWYVNIILQGFTASHCGEAGGICQQASIAFLPAFPMSVRGLMQLGLSLPLASWLLNSVCLVLAIWGLRRLAFLKLGAEAPSNAAWALLAFPSTLFFSAGYAEAMFAASSIWAMVFFTEERSLPAALALAVGALCRPHGIVLVGCVVLFALLRKRLKLAGVIVLVTSVVFAAYLFWQYRTFDDALAFLHARKAWGSQKSAWVTFLDYWNRTSGSMEFTMWQDFFGAILIGLTAAWSFKKLGPEYGLFCLLLLALPLSQGQFWGMGRAVLGAFPVFLMLGSAPAPLRAPLAFFGLSLASIDAMLFINGYFVA